MISSKLHIERWGNEYHGTATVTGCTFVIEGPHGRAFPSIQAVVDAAHERFPLAAFEMDFQVMSPSRRELFRGVLHAVVISAFLCLVVWGLVELLS